MVVVAEAVRMAVVAMIVVTMVVAAIVAAIVPVLVLVCVVLAHASIPLAGSAMCSNMVESRLLMWTSTAE